jgi:23S rRNA (adenine-N6)-dimethyltransferase
MQSELAVSQHFFHSHALVDRLLDDSSIQPGDMVLDLGAGKGILADRLAHRGCRVLAVERDPHLVASLVERFTQVPNVRVCDTDILDVRLPRSAYKVFASIPFNTTAAIVNRLTAASNPPRDAYLVVQRDAAERFVGKPRPTLVAVLLMPWFEASIVHRFRVTDFAPPPRVDVVMLRLHKRGPPFVRDEDRRLFRDFVVHLFTTRSTSVLESLERLLGRRRARIVARRFQPDPAIAPGSIPVERWLQLFAAALTVAPLELQWRLAGSEQRLRARQRRLHKLHRTRAVSARRPLPRRAFALRPTSVNPCRPPPL